MIDNNNVLLNWLLLGLDCLINIVIDIVIGSIIIVVVVFDIYIDKNVVINIMVKICRLGLVLVWSIVLSVICLCKF